MTQAWIVMPFVDLWDQYTRQAAEDCMAQEGVGDVRLLLVANDCSDEDLRKAEEWVRLRNEPGLFLWNHRPSLPALSGTWNRALEAAWEAGATEALVVNNDVRLHPATYDCLLRSLRASGALFVSAVGVRESDWPVPADTDLGPSCYDPHSWSSAFHDGPAPSLGGPDYSCFLISKECHERFPFDPVLTYCNDLDHHRRIMLAGEGKRIFSVNVPYLHYASRTLGELPPEKANLLRKSADQHRAYYAMKWGGGVNEETFREPFSKKPETGVTTAELQREQA